MELVAEVLCSLMLLPKHLLDSPIHDELQFLLGSSIGIVHLGTIVEGFCPWGALVGI